MAFKRNITLQRKINALSDKGSCFIADKVAKAAADDDCSGCVIEDVVAKQTPGKIHAEEMQFLLRPHEFCAGQLFSEYFWHKGEKQILYDRYPHAEYKKVKDLIDPFGSFRVLLLKILPFWTPPFHKLLHILSSLYRCWFILFLRLFLRSCVAERSRILFAQVLRKSAR